MSTRKLIEDIERIKTEPPRALIVEDDSNDAHLLAAELDKLGSESHWCRTADSAIQELSNPHRFQIIFLDLKLHGSMETWQKVCEAASAIPVVIVSGYLDSKTLGPEWGNLAAIQKPVTTEHLKACFLKHKISIRL